MEAEIDIKQVLSDMKVTVKVVGLSSIRIRLKIAGYLLRLGCWIGGLTFIKE